MQQGTGSRPQGLAIAPFYDIVSTVQYRELDAEFAMAFGDEFNLAAVGPLDWADFAHRTKLPRAALVREMRRIGKATRRHASELANSPEYTAEERDMVLKIAATVTPWWTDRKFLCPQPNVAFSRVECVPREKTQRSVAALTDA